MILVMVRRCLRWSGDPPRTSARAPSTRGWFVGRKRCCARKQTEQALLKLAEGDYQQVEKPMSKNAITRQQPVVNVIRGSGSCAAAR
ncbi:heme biosynthesis HemY N-terminal domain-containing protein [Shigella flexneri]